ncbi:glycoside hydrolase family 5 protein [Maricaulis sp.]|uniref:glycoside hydrolase family 5 protein n=1 Tax=Maricaulis sp. TaxID=1486257 RepID=UPI002B264E32|nr:cellulase family glycosylhydrolase [Maricaulis sp.]
MTGLTRRQGLVAAGAGLLGARSAQAQPARRDLWDNTTGARLRGAVIAQRRVYPQIDGPDFLGPGPVGAPVTEASLARLSALGANLVVLSVPGPADEAPPFAVDPAIEQHLHTLVRRCGRHGLFVVIGFRSGPGRSEFSFHRDQAGTWFPASFVDESVWHSREAQDGWDAMWRRTASRFRHYPNLAGYLLMVEPNANLAAPGPDGGDLDIWQAERLATEVAGTPADWPALASRLARAVRAEDPDTPILVSPDGYAATRFAGLLDMEAAAGLVLAVHDYAPRAYTHQDAGAGIGFDPELADFEQPVSGPWMLGEFGVSRWAPDADRFLASRIAAAEAAGAAWSVFRWDSGWRVYENAENRFNPLYGGDPGARHPDANSILLDRLSQAWSSNMLRPAPLLRR